MPARGGRLAFCILLSHFLFIHVSLLVPPSCSKPGHSTVDAEVDGVGEEDAGVDQHGHGVGQGVVDEVQVHAVGGGDGGWRR